MDAAAEKDLKEVETEIGEMVSPLAPGALSSASSPCCESVRYVSVKFWIWRLRSESSQSETRPRFRSC
jgi:hypothetical protein